jgi:hypothetical protein
MNTTDQTAQLELAVCEQDPIMPRITATSELPDGICVLFDGGCSGNHLPVSQMSQRKMYGSMAVFHNRKLVASSWQVSEKPKPIQRFEFTHKDGHASSPLSEYLTLENALSYVFALRSRSIKTPVTKVTIIGDNETAIGFGSGTHEPTPKSAACIHETYFSISHLVSEITKWGCELDWRNADEKWVKRILGH